jgi:hypothetical protein
MSISGISSGLYAPIYVAPVIPASAAAGPSDAVLNVTTQVNANGTITQVTTYANGSTTSVTTLDPNAGPGVSIGPFGLFNLSNSAQAAILLNAQAFGTGI